MNRRAIALTVDPVRPLLDLSGWCRASEESDKLASMVGSRGRRTGICGRGWSAWHSGARSRKCGQTSGADRISDLSEFAARPVSRGRSGHAGRRSDQVGELRDGLPLAYVAILVHSPVVAGCHRLPSFWKEVIRLDGSRSTKHICGGFWASGPGIYNSPALIAARSRTSLRNISTQEID